jgi:hypothetical protein
MVEVPIRLSEACIAPFYALEDLFKGLRWAVRENLDEAAGQSIEDKLLFSKGSEILSEEAPLFLRSFLALR